MQLIEPDSPFDPADPYDAMCDSFRLQVIDLAHEALKVTIYRDMTPTQQLSAFMAGTITGLVGVCFASIHDEGRDEMMRAILEALPSARRQVEGILDSAQPGAQP